MLATRRQSTTDSDYSNSVKCNEILNIEKMEHNCEVNVSDDRSNFSIFKIEDNFGLTALVGNLTNNVTSKILNGFLVNEGSLNANDINRIGEIWKFVKENDTYGVTFVEFSSGTAFQTALTLNNKELNGKNIIILPAVLSHQGLISLFASCPCPNITDTQYKERNILGNIQKNEEVSISTDNINNDLFENNEKGINSTADCKEIVAISKIDNNFQTANEEIDNKLPTSQCDEVTKTEDYLAPASTNSVKMEENDAKISEEVKLTLEDLNTISKKAPETVSKSQIDTEQNKFVAIIKNLPPNTKEEDLLKFFSIAQESVLEISLLKNMRRRSEYSMRAIITFISEECLKQCLNQTETYFNSRQIFVEKYDKAFSTKVGIKRQNKINRTSTDSTLMSPNKVDCKTSKNRVYFKDKFELDLFIKHIPKEVSDRQLTDFFSSAGALITKIYRFPDVHKGRGMAFITMEDRDSVIKGLAMNCKIISGIKIRVCVRNDRKHLAPPCEDENFPNFSTFIGKLPIKQSADALKLSLKKFFETSGCAINFINVPHALNHSGNRGYAFIIFEDEESLLKCERFHKTAIFLDKCKVVVDVSNQWPEMRLGPTIDVREKPREMTYSQEDLLRGRQNKRRRKGTTPTRTPWDSKFNDSYASLLPNPLYQSNPSNYPSDLHSSQQSNSLDNTDYKNYLDYWDQNDYSNTGESFSTLEAQVSNCHEEFRAQSMEAQGYPNSRQHAQSTSLSVYNPEFENGVGETSSYSSRGYRDLINYDMQSLLPSGSCKWRDSPDYRVTSQRSGTTDPDCVPTSSLKMGSSSGLNSVDSQLYDTSTSSYEYRNPFYSDRDIVPLFSKPFSSQEGKERRNSMGSLTSNYYQSMRETDYDSSASIPSNSNLRPVSTVPSNTAQNDGLFTRLDRRSVPFRGSDFLGCSGSSDRSQKPSYSSVSSTNRCSGEITRYGHHLLQADEKRQPSTYDKPSSFVTKLASAGILSNAGYDTYPGVGGYRAN